MATPSNVIRTVHEYEAAEVSGIHLEDQTAPKRCGHMAGKNVIAVGEAVGKIKAAVAAKSDPHFVIIGRTDALAVHGIDAAVDRARRYADAGAGAGADVVWVEPRRPRPSWGRSPRSFPASMCC